MSGSGPATGTRGRNTPTTEEPAAAAAAAPDLTQQMQSMLAAMAAMQRELEQQKADKIAMQQQHEEQLAEIRSHIATSAPAAAPAAASEGAQPMEVDQQQERQQQYQAQLSLQQQRALLAQAQPGSPQAPRLPAVVPDRLTYKDAADRQKLEDWIYAANKMLRQQKLTDAPWAQQVRVLEWYWDLALSRWWESTSEVKRKQGGAITSWEQLQVLMRSSFLSTADEDTAVAEMRKAEMKASEDMLEYTQRIAALHARINAERMPAHVTAEHLAEGLAVVRFPFLVATYKREQAEHRKLHGGKGMEFEAVKDRLLELAKSEPTEVAAMAKKEAAAAHAAAGGRGGASSSSGSSGWQKKPPSGSTGAGSLAKKLSAIAMSLEAQAAEEGGVEGFSEEERYFIQTLMGGSKGGAATTPAIGAPQQQARCFRCKKLGHAAHECEKPDMRVCYGCGETGHLKRDCPKQKAGGQNAPAAPKQKNV